MAKILIIEDSPTIGSLLTERLKASKFEVISAENGKVGLDKIRTLKPDLVLLDVFMPEMNGYEVCRIAKSDPELKNIPIVFLTACAQDADIEKGRAAGGDGYLTKPYEGKALITEIQRLLKKQTV